MHELEIDIETYSSVDLKKTSTYRYVEAPDFEVLLIGFALDGGEVEVIDLTKDRLPPRFAGWLLDPDYLKLAYNASFERVCLSQCLRAHGWPLPERYLPPEQWHCTMVHAATLGLPRSLEDVGNVLGLGDGERKLGTGKALIRRYCVPCKPTKANGGRTRYESPHRLNPMTAELEKESWQAFIEYNRQDVKTEQILHAKLEKYPLPDEEWAAYWMDQRINDRGVQVDCELARSCIRINREHSDLLSREAEELTGLSNVNSVAQLKTWLGHEGSLDKKAISELRKGDLSASEDRVLAIRQELGKTSVSKYEAMLDGACSDGRVRGLFAFYGANRTGRWAGRQVQVQNLPQNHLPDLDSAREIARRGDREELQMLFGNVPATLSELIRTAFIPAKGNTLVVADFSAIEARVVAWLANEAWRQEVFRKGGDIYCASASQMFHVPVEKHGVNGHLRQKGKIAELALGYGGGVGAMRAMGALDMGINEAELQPIVTAWRESNPRVVDLWWQIDQTAKQVVQLQAPAWCRTLPHGLSMRYRSGMLHIKLPSGRCIRYWKPGIGANKFGGESITYDGVETGGWGRIETYGPKLFENIVQATARDCLRDAMRAVEAKYPGIVMHIHDEMVVEVPKEKAEQALEEMLRIMSQPVPWAPGLLLKGDGYITPYYRKD